MTLGQFDKMNKNVQSELNEIKKILKKQKNCTECPKTLQ